jgi:hypothetical protein
MKIIKTFVISLGVASTLMLVVNSCTTKVDLSPTKVSFKSDVLPIIAGNCQFSSCHGTEDYARIQLIDYKTVAKHCTANNPQGSSLYQSMTGKGAQQMPPDPYADLSQESLKTVYDWINQGALNN